MSNFNESDTGEDMFVNPYAQSLDGVIVISSDSEDESSSQISSGTGLPSSWEDDSDFDEDEINFQPKETSLEPGEIMANATTPAAAPSTPHNSPAQPLGGLECLTTTLSFLQ